jgi:diketogulonate reductase-like aldo/keto reductase
MEDGTIPYMHDHNITTIAYFTIKQGGMKVDEYDENELLVKLAKKYSCRPTQIAINWVTSFPRTIALVKATNGTHINENVGAVGWEMTKDEYEAVMHVV